VSVVDVTSRPDREVIDGRYELVDTLGEGGMGTVYRALQLPIEREVAVKILRVSHLDKESDRAVKRFYKEARAIASLHHPNIVPMYDFGQTERGDLFLVMELLPGQALSSLIRAEESFSIQQAASILDQVLDVLHLAHAENIVHRDLKPENIQIGTRGMRSDFVTVMDFGLARAPETSNSAKQHTTIEVAGTPAYMSPEQILGTSVDPRSDIYSVGVLLFEMITGTLPFQSDRAIDVYMGHLKESVPRLSDLMPAAKIPPGLQELLDRVLAKAACERMPDAVVFRRALRAVAGFPPLDSNAGRSSPSRRVVALNNTSLGYELVAAVEPARSLGVEELMYQWSLDITQHGGTVRERRLGVMVATFPGLDQATRVIRAAMVMKQRTRAQRLSTLRPLYIRVGIHRVPSVAERLSEEAPRGGVVIGADCVEDGMVDVFSSGLRFERAGELRIRGQRGPVRLLHLISGR